MPPWSGEIGGYGGKAHDPCCLQVERPAEHFQRIEFQPIYGGQGRNRTTDTRIFRNGPQSGLLRIPPMRMDAVSVAR